MSKDDINLVRRLIEELDAFASLKPPLLSSILQTRQAYLFLRQHVDSNELKALLKGLNEMQRFYRRSPTFRLLLLLTFAVFLLTLTYPLLPPSLNLPLSSLLAIMMTFIIIFGNFLMLPHMALASRLFASQAREARRISKLLIEIYGEKVGALTLFHPCFGMRILRKSLVLNPFLAVKFLVVPP